MNNKSKQNLTMEVINGVWVVANHDFPYVTATGSTAFDAMRHYADCTRCEVDSVKQRLSNVEPAGYTP